MKHVTVALIVAIMFGTSVAEAKPKPLNRADAAYSGTITEIYNEFITNKNKFERVYGNKIIVVEGYLTNYEVREIKIIQTVTRDLTMTIRGKNRAEISTVSCDNNDLSQLAILDKIDMSEKIKDNKNYVSSQFMFEHGIPITVIGVVAPTQYAGSTLVLKQCLKI